VRRPKGKFRLRLRLWSVPGATHRAPTTRLLERGDAHRLSWRLWGASGEGAPAAPGLAHEAAIAFDPEDEQQALSMIDRIQVDGLRLRAPWLAGLRVDLRLLRHVRLPHSLVKGKRKPKSRYPSERGPKLGRSSIVMHSRARRAAAREKWKRRGRRTPNPRRSCRESPARGGWRSLPPHRRGRRRACA